jgi:hypothetical protein
MRPFSEAVRPGDDRQDVGLYDNAPASAKHDLVKAIRRRHAAGGIVPGDRGA